MEERGRSRPVVLTYGKPELPTKTRIGSSRSISYALIALGLFLAIFGQLLLTANRSVPIGFALCGGAFMVAGAMILYRQC